MFTKAIKKSEFYISSNTKLIANNSNKISLDNVQITLIKQNKILNETSNKFKSILKKDPKYLLPLNQNINSIVDIS